MANTTFPIGKAGRKLVVRRSQLLQSQPPPAGGTVGSGAGTHVAVRASPSSPDSPLILLSNLIPSELSPQAHHPVQSVLASPQTAGATVTFAYLLSIMSFLLRCERPRAVRKMPACGAEITPAGAPPALPDNNSYFQTQPQSMLSLGGTLPVLGRNSATMSLLKFLILLWR